MDLSALTQLDPVQLRALLPGFLAGFIAEPEASARNAARIAAFVSDWDDETCRRVVGILATVGSDQCLYPADPACRQLARVWSEDVIVEPGVRGIEHLQAAVDAGPTVILCNHLSYFDSTAIDAMLVWNGHADLADRLVSAAGPKVYQALFRRVAASCLNTLPVPQSTSFSHTEQLSPRELARRAITSMKIAAEAIEGGMVLLLYPEGSRTRTGRMGPFLKAVHRYLKIAEPLRVVPTAIVGTGELMPVDDERMHPMHATLRFGPALEVGPAGPAGPGLSARDALAETHRAIAALLPEDHRPDRDTPPVT